MQLVFKLENSYFNWTLVISHMPLHPKQLLNHPKKLHHPPHRNRIEICHLHINKMVMQFNPIWNEINHHSFSSFQKDYSVKKEQKKQQSQIFQIAHDRGRCDNNRIIAGFDIGTTSILIASQIAIIHFDRENWTAGAKHWFCSLYHFDFDRNNNHKHSLENWNLLRER